MEKDVGLDQSDNGGEMWLDSKGIWKIEPTGFADGLDVKDNTSLSA